LLVLELPPARPHSPCSSRLGVAEDVRVPADELPVDQPRDRLQVALAALLQEQREEVDLEEKVAEFVTEAAVVPGQDGVGDLVGLLDRVRHNRRRRLLPVPGAVPAKAPCQLLEVEERLRQ